MTAERFRQIRNVFEAAMDRSDAERVAWLEEACRDDAPLRAEVDALLKQYQKTSGLLDTPAVDAAAVAKWRMEGRQVGAWEILREIGRGGMAAVYLARRSDGAFHMQAAVKVLTTPFADDEIRKRFQQEREILAQLDHPNIARLLDGGTTEDGLPFLVMEYVEGQPLTAWCDARKASIEERLLLFEELCGVVHYLHEHHVIHRDLKPTNVLVNTAGSVKLLDFGISKLLEPITDRTILATQSGLHLLTPEYASPEQVRGERVTPRTDVYALGVILYELLTGHRPYRLRSRVIHEVVRAICEDEPERPSTAIAKPDESVDPVTSSRLRQASPERLSRVLRGDLDEIVMKTLRKAPERRYRTARQLADDLSAHSQRKSVLARGDSWPVRVFGILNQHRAPVALVILTTVLLVSGAVTVHRRAIVYGASVLVAVAFWYAATDRKLGRRLASAGMTVGMFAWLIVVWAHQLLPPAFARVVLIAVPIAGDALWVGLALYNLGVWVCRRRWGGELVLDASTRKHSKFLAVLVLFGALLLIIAAVVSRERVDVLVMCAAAALLLLQLWATHGKLEFRQHGIVNAGHVIPWDKIDSWAWQSREASPVEVEDIDEVEVGHIASAVFGSNPSAGYFEGGSQFLDQSPALEPAVLNIERRRSVYFLPPVRIEVAASKVTDITQVMNRYLSDWPT